MIEIYKEGKKGEQSVFLKVYDEGDFIEFKAVNQAGERLCAGRLFRINKKTGKIRVHSYVNSTFGFDLDSDGQLRIN